MKVDLGIGERRCLKFVMDVKDIAGKRQIFIQLPSDVQTCDCFAWKAPLVIVTESTGDPLIDWAQGTGSVFDSQSMIEALVLANRISRQLIQERKAKQNELCKTPSRRRPRKKVPGAG